MCSVHHTVIDAESNLETYTVERLLEIKREHENEFHASGRPALEISDAAINGLIIQGIAHEPHVHMDFRNALFKVGGEGGHPLGAGGQGGVLTIVGMASLPPDIELELDGKPGSAPGGGGGGGGMLRFEGRSVTSDDMSGGVRVSSFFSANAVSDSRNGAMFNVLDGGCSYYSLPKQRQPLWLSLVVVVECGSAAPNELLRLDIACDSPSGNDCVVGYVDIAVPSDIVVKRTYARAIVSITVEEIGIYTLKLQSESAILATYPIEVRA